MATLGVLIQLGCGEEPTPQRDPDGGAPVAGCAVGEATNAEGDCVAAGVPEDACGIGFEPDGNRGCAPMLPERACAEGMLAVPGDSRCRPVGACGPAPYGDRVEGRGTQFVLASYRGGDSDGSAERPWTSIQAAIDAAAAGATVAVGDGEYVEGIVIEDKAVHLEGRCAETVRIAATSAHTVAIRPGADGTTISGVRIRAASSTAVHLSGALDVLVERTWIHGGSGRGVQLQNQLGASRMLLRDSLVEQTTEIGVTAFGSELTIERSVVRDTVPAASGVGRGVHVQDDEASGVRATLTMGSTVVEDCTDLGVSVAGADAQVRDSVVRGTRPFPDGSWGRGLMADKNRFSNQRTSLRVERSVFSANHEIGLFVQGSDAEIAFTTIVDQGANAVELGRGVDIDDAPDDGDPSNGTLTHCLVAANRDVGISVIGSHAKVRSTVVSRTLPNGLGLEGRGVNAQSDKLTGVRPTIEVVDSVVEDSHTVGVFVGAGELRLVNTAVRRVFPRPSDGLFGMGVAAQFDPRSGELARADLQGCLIEDVRDVGVSSVDAELALERTTIRRTSASATGTFGDGVAIVGVTVSPLATISHGIIEQSARAGAAAFGASIHIDSTTLDCNAIALDSERWGERDASLVDEGGNVCGCAGVEEPCQASSSALAAPEPLP